MNNAVDLEEISYPSKEIWENEERLHVFVRNILAKHVEPLATTLRMMREEAVKNAPTPHRIEDCKFSFKLHADIAVTLLSRPLSQEKDGQA